MFGKQAQQHISETLELLRATQQKEETLQQQLKELQTVAFDMSSQLVMGDREILRTRKELTRALASEARIRTEADEQLKTMRSKEADLRAQLAEISAAKKASMRLSIEGIQLAAKGTMRCDCPSFDTCATSF